MTRTRHSPPPHRMLGPWSHGMERKTETLTKQAHVMVRFHLGRQPRRRLRETWEHFRWLSCVSVAHNQGILSGHIPHVDADWNRAQFLSSLLALSRLALLSALAMPFLGARPGSEHGYFWVYSPSFSSSSTQARIQVQHLPERRCLSKPGGPS